MSNTLKGLSNRELVLIGENLLLRQREVELENKCFSYGDMMRKRLKAALKDGDCYKKTVDRALGHPRGSDDLLMRHVREIKRLRNATKPTETAVKKLTGTAVRALIDAQDRYITALSEEIHELVYYAASRGWQSSRIEAGWSMREEIVRLRSKVDLIIKEKGRVRKSASALGAQQRGR